MHACVWEGGQGVLGGGGLAEDQTIEDVIPRGVCHLDAFIHFRWSGASKSIQSWDT